MEERGCEPVGSGGLTFLELRHRLINLLCLNWAHEDFIVLRCYQFGDVAGDSSDRSLPVFLLLSVNLLKVIEKDLFYLLMLFDFYPFMVKDKGNLIVHPPLYCSSVEEFGIALPFL